MEQQKKYDVFISYSRKDSVIADEICQAFDRVGVTYFIDRKGMGGTANYVTKIAEEIDNSKAMLLLSSANSYKSKYVSIELHYAFNHDVVVLPYALDDTPVPKDFEILLIHANWHYFSEDPIIPTLLTSVSELVNKSITSIFTPEPTPIPTPEPSPVPAPTPKPTPKPSSKSIKKSWIWRTMAACAIVGLVIIGVRQVQQGPTILDSPADIEQEQTILDTDVLAPDSIATHFDVPVQDSVAKITTTNTNITKSTEIATTNNTTTVSTVSKEKSDAKGSSSKAQTQDGVVKESNVPTQKKAKSTTTKSSSAVVPTPTKEESTTKASQTLNDEELDIAKRQALPKGEFQVGNLKYKASEKESGVTVAKYVNKDIQEIRIPSQITYGNYTYDVTSIGDEAFRYCFDLTSITIPNSVTSIGKNAFRGCSCLTSITIPNSVTSIGESAFSSCRGLTSIIVEKGNKTYDSRENCNAIIETTSNTLIAGCKNTIIPNNVRSIGEYAFLECSGLTSITIPNSVTSIGQGAFLWCKGLTSITIPNSVTSIGEGAFCLCSGLTSITIPNSVTSIGENAFNGCVGLTSIIVEKGNKEYDSRENCNAIIETASNTLIEGCKNTIIPNSVTSIGKQAFRSCSDLTSITIPNSVTSIGDEAFKYCSGLTSITIPNSVTSIGENAFAWCSDLTSITIPNNVTSIGESAFWGCEGLTSITIPNSVTSIGESAFSSCRGLTSIIVEKGNKTYNSRKNCNAIIETTSNTLIAGCKNTIIPNGVTSIGENAFAWCSDLTSITIPNSVTSIGNSAFEGCSGLTSITIPNSVKSIGENAFTWCSSLKSITIPKSLTNIGENAFPEHTKIIRK